MSTDFPDRVLAWFDRYGRRDLPWQTNPTPYRVWVSEIMLQQTQVETVRDYFARFIATFADVRILANARLDEVLHLWSGLGYYARARNLHKAAGIVRDEYGGRFPETIDELQALPGIGRSTAGAILALARGQRHPILDGNVKRVLARHGAIQGWPGSAPVTRCLWALADTLTPSRRVADYTQAMMDLGATVCRRTRPLCAVCPVMDDCLAQRRGIQTQLPTPRPKRELPVRAVRMLMITDRAGHVMLQRRPPAGVWGGLWGFPECPADADLGDWCRVELALTVGVVREWPGLRHTFSHFHLDITPVELTFESAAALVMEDSGRLWYNPRQPEPVGVAAPVARLLAALG
jgi:A/G-specific adenine glycosylase